MDGYDHIVGARTSEQGTVKLLRRLLRENIDSMKALLESGAGSIASVDVEAECFHADSASVRPVICQTVLP